MASAAVHSERSRVSSLFDLAATIEDQEVQAHFARYLAVRLCGLLESTAKALVSEYSKRTANSKTASFCAFEINSFRNPNTEKLLALAGRFDPDWRLQLEVLFDGRTGEAVNSIKALRDAIAHGVNHNASLGTVAKYRDEIFRTVELLERLFS